MHLSATIHGFLHLFLPKKRRLVVNRFTVLNINPTGTIEQFNARLVVLGNKQIKGIDFIEAFAPVAKMVTVRVFFSVAVIKGWELDHMDVHNAFLHGNLDDTMYMTTPFGNAPPGMVCKLLKSLYGLRQSPGNGSLSWLLPLGPLDFNKVMLIIRFFHFHDMETLCMFLSMLTI